MNPSQHSLSVTPPEEPVCRTRFSRCRDALLIALLYGASAVFAWGQTIPGYVFSSPLVPLIMQMPENSWLKVNTNLYSDVWTPPELEPLDNSGVTHTPSKIILAWSGFAWDSNRGDLIIYGGGHANYSGNDVYRWRSATMQWERAALPSEIYNDPVAGFVAIDGVDAAPIAAHTYDNNTFLPVVDRFLTFGGATYNNDGGPYRRVSEIDPTKTRFTGPYLFDPSRADGNKVGGTTGSNVKRVLSASITGGQMWENRDIPLHLAGQPMPQLFGSGCSVPAVEAGRDVVYLGATTNAYSTDLDLYRYQLNDITNPALDQISKVGSIDVVMAGITTCGYDPLRKLFVRTGNNSIPFLFWDLTAPSPTNGNQAVQIDATIAGLQSWLTSQSINLQNCALKFDPVRRTFPLWCGAATVWELHPPTSGNTPSGWTITQLPTGTLPAPPGDTGGTGVLGKWRYAPFYDVFIGLEDIIEGHVWIYKPPGWVQPNPAGNALPVVSVTSPGSGATVAPGTPLNLTAAAFDADGSIARVEYYANGVKLGQATSAPYAVPWTPLLVGSYTIVAIAVDNVGGMTASVGVNLTVSAPITTAVLQRGLGGYTGISDTFLNAGASSTPYGASNPLYLDGSNLRPLVRFAVFQSEGGPVPDGAVIQSAKLELYKQYYDIPLQLNALQLPWVEAQATWLNPQTGLAWNAPGAGGAGSDYLTTPDVITTGSFYPGWMAFDVTARVRQWSNKASANYGWRVSENVPNDVNILGFNSSEYAADPTLRPKLTVVYAPPVTGNVPPTVVLTSPADGARITLGASFSLAATATDSDGSVSKVEFFANGVSLGTDTAAPYTLNWTPAATGSYTLTAVATDNLGATTTSATITVSVSLPAQLALYRPSTNRYFVDYDRDHVVDLKTYFGAPGDVGLAGRFDGDTLTDFVLYRGGIWYADTNRDGVADLMAIFGGVAGDIPLLADFDGDGRDDLVIYRHGIWYVRTTLTGVASQTYYFGGLPGDIPLAGDVNGDGIPDLVIFRGGVWYISTKRDGIADKTVYFGAPGDTPLLLDWDGDGKADLCVFRDGIWYVNTHLDGTLQAIFGFGTTGDVPLTGRFN